MPRFINKRSKKAGLSPGALIHVGEKKTDTTRITLINYNQELLQEKEIRHIEEAFQLKDEPTVTWINIDGLHDVSYIEKIGKQFDIHPLVLEDILNAGQRSKVEDYDDYLYIVFKMLYYDKETNQIKSEQVSIILGEHYIISFQEVEGDVFDAVRDRLRKGKGRIRKGGCDYLAYALMDATVDHYFAILETFSEKIEFLEETLVQDPAPRTLQTLHEMKREMIFFRKQVWPLRELLGQLHRGETSHIQETTGIFFRDVYDHTIQVIDTIESFRDIMAGMLDIYLSTISNKMNEIMKVLTIIATIFIPLTFIAGVYGMNFKYMPELQWRWGYLMAWGIMWGMFILMFIYFRKKKWL